MLDTPPVLCPHTGQQQQMLGRKDLYASGSVTVHIPPQQLAAPAHTHRLCCAVLRPPCLTGT